ncbi:MAG: DUF3179 domain-containing protein [Alphaproteobacteria bacterium]
MLYGRMKRLVHLLAAMVAALAFAGGADAAGGQHADDDIGAIAARALASDPAERAEALDVLVKRGKPDVVAALIQAYRFVPNGADIDAAIAGLTGETPGKSWGEWMLWQQSHPEIEPFAGFDRFKADVMAAIDPNFRVFLPPDVAHDIRLEEIVWGGVLKDGIPALTQPKHLAAHDADYLTPDELVFGIDINGDIRAYPLRIMDWHEMVNDVVGGQPVSLAYCTLCGSGILYKTDVEGRSEPLIFGSSGFLYRSNKLMYDQATKSLWNQFTGRPVVGALTGTGIELDLLPVAITSWSRWLAQHPDSKVLSLDTGYERDYTPNRPYGDYFASADLMFPALVEDERLGAKDYVYAVRVDGLAKAWPLTDFEGGQIVNDRIGDLRVVLIGDADTRTVRAFVRDDVVIQATDDPTKVLAGGQPLTVQEDSLVAEDGRRFERLPGHIAYWFAWQGFIAGGPLAEAD